MRSGAPARRILANCPALRAGRGNGVKETLNKPRFVIPAQAGIQFVPPRPKGCKIKQVSLRARVEVLDSRLRGNDGGCLVFRCRVDTSKALRGNVKR
jgi:hypothetical protein